MNPEQLPPPGLLEDTRPPLQKAKDYKFSEIVSATAPVAWKEKKQKDWRKFPIQNQGRSGSCVAQTLRKMYGIYIKESTGAYVDLSASHIYQRRMNKPQAGMLGSDAFKIGQKGTTLEVFAPSENLTDAQMDAVRVIPFMEKVGEVFKLGNYVEVDPPNFETVASIIQATGKGVMCWFYFKADEWKDVPLVKYPNLVRQANDTLRHSITLHDPILYKGKKGIVSDESWGLGTAMNGQRVITEDFFKKRCFFVGHFQNFKFEEGATPRPRYDGTVKSLQDCLKYEGVFPLNVESTGVFGNITTQAVKDFQAKYGLEQVGTVGPLTSAKLKELYP